jgi:hypothetical protein
MSSARWLVAGLLSLSVCAGELTGCANGPDVEICIIGREKLQCSYDEKQYERPFYASQGYLCIAPKDYNRVLKACRKGGAPEVEVCFFDQKGLVCQTRNYTLPEAVNFICMSDVFLGRLIEYCAK